MAWRKEKNHIKIFQNNRKMKPSHGVEFDIAMWKLTTKSGQVYFAGQIGNSEENRKKYKSGKPAEEKPKSDVDELPF
jgi:hypothetical protein